MSGKKTSIRTEQETETENLTLAEKQLFKLNLSKFTLNYNLESLIRDADTLDNQLPSNQEMENLVEADINVLNELTRFRNDSTNINENDSNSNITSGDINYLDSNSNQCSSLSGIDEDSSHSNQERSEELVDLYQSPVLNKENISPDFVESNEFGKDSMETQFDTTTSLQVESDSDSESAIELSLSDIKSDFSEFIDFVILFFFVHDVKDVCAVFTPKSMCLTFKTNYNILDHEDNSTRDFIYVLNLSFKYEIDEKVSNVKPPKRKCIEIRLHKKEKLLWNSIRDVCQSTPMARTDKCIQQAKYSPDTWTPCTLSPHEDTPPNNRLALVPYQNNLVSGNENNFASKNNQFYGYTGLVNMGNTCFMNSVLQCLANTVTLKEYFVSASYLNDINKSNPLGTRGECAKAFAHFLTQLWTGKQSSFPPHKIKDHIADKVASFSGFAQHDAQEFMSYLLDVIHEDLNNNQNKDQAPTINDEETLFSRDTKDCSNESEIALINNRLVEISNKMWQRYRYYNNSIIIDQFCGQFKSILSCPDCHKKSITFDPFLFVPLPIPPTKNCYRVFYFTRDEESGFCNSKHQILLKISPTAFVSDLVTQVTNYLGNQTSSRNLRVVQPDKSNMPPKYLNVNWLLVHYRVGVDENVPLLLFELPRDDASEEHAEFCVSQRRLVDYENNKNNPIIGYPFVVCVKKSMATYSHICAVFCSYARHSVVSYSQYKRDRKEFHINSFTYENYLKSQTIETYSFEFPHLVYNKLNVNSNSYDMKAPFLIFMPTYNKEEDKEFFPALAEEYNLSRSGSSSGDSSGFESANEKSHSLSSEEPNVLCNGEDVASFESYTQTVYDCDRPIALSTTFYLTLDWITCSNNPNDESAVNIKEVNYDSTSDFINISTEDVTLDECLRCFSDPEVLGPQNKWKCPNCNVLCEASKQLSFWRLPRILVIQLKRFKAHSSFYNNEKIATAINYPIKGLDMSKYLSHVDGINENCTTLYDLYAVVNHTGSSYFGHYTAFARSSNGDLGWRGFDDTIVKDISEEIVITPRAYLLFYIMRGF